MNPKNHSKLFGIAALTCWIAFFSCRHQGIPLSVPESKWPRVLVQLAKQIKANQIDVPDIRVFEIEDKTKYYFEFYSSDPDVLILFLIERWKLSKVSSNDRIVAWSLKHLPQGIEAKFGNGEYFLSESWQSSDAEDLFCV